MLFYSCTKRTPLQQLIHDADVVKVFVYSGNNLVMHYESNDIDKIQQWKNYISDDNASVPGACLPNDKIIFKTSDDSTVMKFSMAKGCNYVSYELSGNSYNQTLTDRGVQYIDSLMRVQ